MVKVEKKDLEDLLKRLQSGGEEEILLHGMEKLGEYGLGVAKKNTPRVSGQLIRGWTVAELSPERVVLRNSTEYAEYVEYGHRQKPGRYVPAIGKRLKRAWVRGVFFAARSEEQIRRNADKVLRPVITKELEKMFNG